MRLERVIDVPLATDAEAKFSFGPFELSKRAVILMILISPLALGVFALGFLGSIFRVAIAAGLFGLAILSANPQKEGVWVGFYWVYGLSGRLVPHLIRGGKAKRGEIVAEAGEGLREVEERDLLPGVGMVGKYVGYYLNVPRAVEWTDSGKMFKVQPGGWQIILPIAGPSGSPKSPDYVRWEEEVLQWMTSAHCQGQFLAKVQRFNRRAAEAGFDKRMRKARRTRLLDEERELVAEVAGEMIGFKHYVVFSPTGSGSDGVPYRSSFTRANTGIESSFNETESLLGRLERGAANLGIEILEDREEDLKKVVEESVLGCQRASAGNGILELGRQRQVVLAATKMPGEVEAGGIVSALMRARIEEEEVRWGAEGTVSLHVIPVSPTVARKVLEKRRSALKFAQNKSLEDIDVAIAKNQTESLIAEIANKELVPCRMALTISVTHPKQSIVEGLAEQLRDILEGDGFRIERITTPGLLPLLAVAPSGSPLLRSLLMTSTSVVARMLPALGTAFSDVSKPFIGINLMTDAPVYMSVWKEKSDRNPLANSNAVIMGSSGAGKSVACKLLLMRHVMEGGAAVVIDPDSEYGPIIDQLGGVYVNIGEDALNPLAVGAKLNPAEAAEAAKAVLSVFAGDEVAVSKSGDPVRRLPIEEQSWLFNELMEFFNRWRDAKRAGRVTAEEPVLSELVKFMKTDSLSRCITEKEKERCIVVAKRLERYTQGELGKIFNRPSTIDMIAASSVGIGLKDMSEKYNSDLTPALVIILNQIFALMTDRKLFHHRIVLVDEAHRLTSDPDAGKVLARLSRQIRKFGGAIWTCSQQIDDFVDTELGRTLIATASTQIVLGVEEQAAPQVAEVFRLKSEEAAALTPPIPGRAMILSGKERALIQIIPGPYMMPLVDTSGQGTDFLNEEMDEDE